MVNQRQKSTLFSYNTLLEKSKSLYNIEMITVFQRRNNFSLSMLNQRRILQLKQHWFWLNIKTFLFLFCSNFDGRKVDVILMHILDSTCFFWCIFKRRKIVVALSLIDKFSIFLKMRVAWLCLFDVLSFRWSFSK